LVQLILLLVCPWNNEAFCHPRVIHLVKKLILKHVNLTVFIYGDWPILNAPELKDFFITVFVHIVSCLTLVISYPHLILSRFQVRDAGSGISFRRKRPIVLCTGFLSIPMERFNLLFLVQHTLTLTGKVCPSTSMRTGRDNCVVSQLQFLYPLGSKEGPPNCQPVREIFSRATRNKLQPD